MANNISRIFNSSFAKRLSNSADDAVKALRKNKNFKKLEPGVKDIVTRKTTQNTVNNIIENIPNKSNDFAKRFGTKLTMNTEGVYDDFGKRIGDMKLNRQNDGIVGVKGEILNPSKAKKNLNFVEPTTKDVTTKPITRLNPIATDENITDIIEEKVTATGMKMSNGSFVPTKLTTQYSGNKDGYRIKGTSTSAQIPDVSTVKRSSLGKGTKKPKDPKADNWVYKAAAAGVGGGLILSMSNSRGQQSNQQLYGQGGY